MQTQLQQAATKLTAAKALELSSLTDANTQLQQTLNKALEDLQSGTACQVKLSEEANSWKSKSAKLQKVRLLCALSPQHTLMHHLLCSTDSMVAIIDCVVVTDFMLKCHPLDVGCN